MDIVTLAAARKGGGSGGDVTRQYVDEHLALKADKSETAEYPIASTTTGINPSITDSADGYVQGLTVYGRSYVSKNLLDTGNSVISNFAEDSEHYVTCTPNTSDSRAWGYANSQYFLTLPAGTYNIVFIAKTQTSNISAGLIISDAENNQLVSISIVNKSNIVDTFTLSATTDIGVMCKQFDAVVRIMICSAADYEADPSFEPYGIISIGDSGSLDVQTCGKNLLNPATIGLYQATSDPSVIRAGYAPIYVHAGTYTLSYNRASTSVTLWITDMSDYSYQQLQPNDQYVVSSGTYIMVRSGLDTVTEFNNIFTNIQLELGSTATAYEPYQSTTATVTTGLPLCGIPVTSGETYTDAQGQKWLADTADVEGVVKRCGVIHTNEWILYPNTTNIYYTQLTNVNTPNSDAGLADIKVIIPENYTETAWSPLGTQDKKWALSADGKFGVYDTNFSVQNPPDFDVVYELATPTTQELTTAEKSALRNLRTYTPTTNVTVTDDPTVDISYLLNTGNGQAVADVQQGLQGQISNIPAFIAAIPEMHRNIFRGKNLGTAVTAAQLMAIADGSFDDLYVGDYWEIPVTIDNVEQSVKWRIADIDYFIGYRDAADESRRMTKHHLVIVPDTQLYDVAVGNRQPYKTSTLRTSGLEKAKTAINTAFPDMVMPHRYFITSDIDSNGVITATERTVCTIELMSDIMLLGRHINLSPSSSGAPNYAINGQFLLFALCPKWKLANVEESVIDENANPYAVQEAYYNSRNGYIAVTKIDSVGPSLANSSNLVGIRPYFLLGDAGT